MITIKGVLNICPEVTVFWSRVMRETNLSHPTYVRNGVKGQKWKSQDYTTSYVKFSLNSYKLPTVSCNHLSNYFSATLHYSY